MTNAVTAITKEKDFAFGKDVYLLGINKGNEKVWLEAPRWDCGWYWGFGYIETYQGNRQPSKARDISSHSHAESLMKHNGVNIYTSPELNQVTFTEKEGWELTELFKQFYLLKETAEAFGRGGCHITTAKIKSWKDETIAKNINEVIIPRVTARILEILSPIEA